MIETQSYPDVVLQFMTKSEEGYIFACQAAVPLILTPDLLYQLWNNFKQFQYVFDDQNTYQIPHIAVSDLLLSGLCRKIGFEIFEIDKEIRDFLLFDLTANLGNRRKRTIATFLHDYGMLEHRYTQRKGLKNIHLLTAQSILNPSEMERQIIQYINDAKSDAEKLNYLLLHKNLLPLGFHSDLAQITNELTDVYGSTFSPMLISEENPKAEGLLHVKLPAVLKGKVKRLIRPQIQPLRKHPASMAEILVAKCIEHNGTYLDLGSCGLTDNDFADTSILSQEIAKCKHLNTLVLSSSWWDETSKRLSYTENKGSTNTFTKLPSFLKALSKLKKLVCGGDDHLPFVILDIGVLKGLSKLEFLDLSNNNLSDISVLRYLKKLRYLDVSYNKITDVSAVLNLRALKKLYLKGNNIANLENIKSSLNGVEVHFSQITLRLFKAIDDPDSCNRYIAGHRAVLERIGITKLLNSQNDWVSNPNIYVIIAEDENDGKVFGGVRIEKATNEYKLPVESALSEIDPKVADIINAHLLEGTGEMHGLWNSRDVAGMGLGAMFLPRAAVAVSTDIGLKSLFALGAPYTKPRLEKLGYEMETSLGNSGEFFFGKSDLIATIMILRDVAILSKAEKEEFDAIMDLRANPICDVREKYRDREIHFRYHLSLSTAVSKK
jgi:Leucine Rich Repeat (LRR) protein